MPHVDLVHTLDPALARKMALTPQCVFSPTFFGFRLVTGKDIPNNPFIKGNGGLLRCRMVFLQPQIGETFSDDQGTPDSPCYDCPLARFGVRA